MKHFIKLTSLMFVEIWLKNKSLGYCFGAVLT